MQPRPVEPWEGVKDATSFGLVCRLMHPERPMGELMVPHAYWPQDEHCQNLNVWSTALSENAKKPVMVWLHGGGFSAGSAIEQLCYDGAAMAKLGDVVVVTINHRLNILGYLDLSPFGEKYKNSNIFRVLDEVSACVQSIVDKLTSEFGFREDRLGIALGGGSAGAHIALLYSYLMKKNSIPIQIKFIINTVGPIGLNTKYFSRLTNHSEPLDNIENLEVLKIAFAQKKIGEYKPTVLFANFMNYFLGKKYPKEFMDSMKINALYVNGSNPNYTLLCDESIYSDITHIKDQRPD